MTHELFVAILRNEYAAVLAMLKQSIALCDDRLWTAETDEPPFWLTCYHAIAWLDFYLSASPKSFEYTVGSREMASFEAQDPEPVSRETLSDYADAVGDHADAVLESVTPAELAGANTFPWTGPTTAHRLVYNVRHAQHHIGELNSLLTRHGQHGPDWVITAIRGTTKPNRKDA